MKTTISKTGAKQNIDTFFLTSDFSSDELIKIKRLAMRFNIKLGNYRDRFCRYCFNPLKGKTRISKTHKAIVCRHCNGSNKIKLS